MSQVQIWQFEDIGRDGDHQKKFCWETAGLRFFRWLKFCIPEFALDQLFSLYLELHGCAKVTYPYHA